MHLVLEYKYIKVECAPHTKQIIWDALTWGKTAWLFNGNHIMMYACIYEAYVQEVVCSFDITLVGRFNHLLEILWDYDRLFRRLAKEKICSFYYCSISANNNILLVFFYCCCCSCCFTKLRKISKILLWVLPSQVLTHKANEDSLTISQISKSYRRQRKILFPLFFCR